ncbi:MAG: hypothetical protein ACT6U0_04560 [Shinella sp.]|uniref:hypothetical protein n=1 Tax=Shinella sp. TaxID=1870904 RepID=UPI004035DFCF
MAQLLLNREAKPCRIAYLSSSHSAVFAALRAGLGVTAMADSTVTDDVRPLAMADGLAPLGHLDVRLHRRATAGPEEAIDYLETDMAERLGQAGGLASISGGSAAR